MLSSGTEQSFIAVIDSRHIYHAISSQEVIAFFFSPRFVPSNESIDQGGSAAVYKITDISVFLPWRGVSPVLPADREVCIGWGCCWVLAGAAEA